MPGVWDFGAVKPATPRSWTARLIMVALAGITIVLGMFGVVALQLTRPGPSNTDVALIIPSGTSVRGISELLINRGVVGPDVPFVLGVRLFGKGRPLQAGEFIFPAGTNALDVLRILQDGTQLARRLTVPEGASVAQFIALLEYAEGLDASNLTIPAEGTLLPETYHYTRGDTAQAVLDRMVSAMDRTIAELWPWRAGNLPLATPEEAIILASIVEKETGLADERAMVAGVFINRLRIGMPLQADPTVEYGVSAGQGLNRPLTYDDLRDDNPYNTYVIPGLPPGPIANPGRAAIEAVLNPAETTALYFVADGTGGHAFADTLAEHNANVARYRALQNADR